MIKVRIPDIDEVIEGDFGANVSQTPFASLNGSCQDKGFLITRDEVNNNPFHHTYEIREKKVYGCVVDEKRIVKLDEESSFGMRLVIEFDHKATEEEIDVCRALLEISKRKNEPLLLGSFPKSLKADIEDPLMDIEEAIHSASPRKRFMNLLPLFQVEPIEWYYDSKADIVVSKEIIVPSSAIMDNGIVDFTSQKQILNTIRDTIEKDIQNMMTNPDVIQMTKELENRKTVQEQFELESPSIEENALQQLRECIMSGVPAFLHGKPGEGKSQRVREIDPECTTLELSLLPIEDLSGTLLYVDQKLKKEKPSWLVKLEDICQREPDKNHVLFLDELTNAAPAIQQLAYSLVLERKVGNTWNLPENVRIVAAGNEVEDSTAASEMPEPLKDRFAHIQVKTSVEEWLEWAEKSNIHPAVITYIAFRGESALRSVKRQGEIITTPRTWERASKQLEATNNVKDLKPIIGDWLTQDFIGFCRVSAISKEDILAGKIGKEIFAQKNIALKMAMVRGLTNVEYEEFDQVREFVKNAGKEALAMFESLWVSKDKAGSTRRIEKVAELRMRDEEKGGDSIGE